MTMLRSIITFSTAFAKMWPGHISDHRDLSIPLMSDHRDLPIPLMSDHRDLSIPLMSDLTMT